MSSREAFVVLADRTATILRVECHVCLISYLPYPGDNKLCPECRAEIDAQTARMQSRGDDNGHMDLRPWREYLAAFDEFLRRPTTRSRQRMTVELALVYERKRLEPPAHRPDLRLSA